MLQHVLDLTHWPAFAERYDTDLYAAADQRVRGHVVVRRSDRQISLGLPCEREIQIAWKHLPLRTVLKLDDVAFGMGPDLHLRPQSKGSLTNVDRVSQPGNYQRLQALQVMENLMQSNSQIDGVLAAKDAMAVGAIEALDGANRKAQVIGINGTKEAIDAIKSGKLLASGDYNGIFQGCLGTMIAIRSLRNQPIINEIVLKPTVITKDNYQPFDQPLEQRTCPTFEQARKLSGK